MTTLKRNNFVYQKGTIVPVYGIYKIGEIVKKETDDYILQGRVVEVSKDIIGLSRMEVNKIWKI